MNNRMEVPVRQPFTFGGVPKSEGGTVTGSPGTALYTDAIYVGDAELFSLAFRVSNVSGTTHTLVESQISFDFDPRTETGNEASSIAKWVDDATEVADSTVNDTDVAVPISVTLAPYVRFKFTGAGSNGAYNRIRGVVFRQ
jgi:hypothetical protein